MTKIHMPLTEALKEMSLVEIMQDHQSHLEDDYVSITQEGLGDIIEALQEGKLVTVEQVSELRTVISDALDNLKSLDNDLEQWSVQFAYQTKQE